MFVVNYRRLYVCWYPHYASTMACGVVADVVIVMVKVATLPTLLTSPSQLQQHPPMTHTRVSCWCLFV